MKLAIMGAGGVGSFLGAQLWRAGVDVTLVARGDHLAAIRRRGLTVSRSGEEFVAEGIKAVEDPAQIDAIDAVILTVKRYDLESACRQVAPILRDGVPVVPVQNGISAADDIRAILGDQYAVGGVIFISAFVEAPGSVRQHGGDVRLIFGELDGSPSERLGRLEETGRAAGLDFRQSAHIRDDLWRKFVLLAGFNPVSCLSRQSIGPILDDPDLSALFAASIEEVVSVGRACGLTFPDDIVEQTMRIAANFEPDARASMLEDLEQGKPLELEWISGEIVRLGNKHSVVTPIHRLAYACLKPFANGQQ